MISFLLSAWLFSPGMVMSVSGDCVQVETSGQCYTVLADGFRAGENVLLLVDTQKTIDFQDDRILGIIGRE